MCVHVCECRVHVCISVVVMVVVNCNYAVMNYLLYLIVSNFGQLHNSKYVIITCFPRNQFLL